MPGTDDIPQQVRRRRDAARRCPPLDCGRRDPLDPIEDIARLLPDHTLDSWIAAAEHTGSWWAIPTAIRPQVRRRLAVRRGAA